MFIAGRQRGITFEGPIAIQIEGGVRKDDDEDEEEEEDDEEEKMMRRRMRM